MVFDVKLTLKLLPLFGVFYLTLFFFSEVSNWVLFDLMSIDPQPIDKKHSYLFVIFLFLFFTPWLYLINSFFVRQFLKIDIPTLILYVGVVFCCAILIEITVNTLFTWVLDRPAWLYKIFSVHNGYTSASAPVLWTIYAFHLYLFHQVIKIKDSKFLDNNLTKAVLVGMDAMILEVFANTFSLLFFDSYYFYYLRGDLNHFTTIEIFIPYVVCSFFGLSLLSFLNQEHKPKKFIGLSFYLCGLAIISGL